MPLTAIKFKPGIVKEVPSYANKTNYSACDKVRFRFGFPEKIGGWVNQSAYTFIGVARSLFNWVTYTGANLLAFGTNQKYYVQNSVGGKYNDITPIRAVFTLAADPFATVINTQVVTVTAAAHGASVNSFVTYSGVSGGGVFNGITLNGEFEIVRIIDGNSYTIAAPVVATGTGSGGGAAVVATYQINAGNSIATLGTGWGSGSWGSGGWGLGSSPSARMSMRLWTQGKTGENLLFAPRGGPIYYWVVDIASYTRGVLLSDAADAVVKTSKTLTFGGGSATVTIDSSDITGTLGVNTGSFILGTNITAGTYVGPTWDGSMTIPLYLNGVPTTTAGASSGTYNFSYSGKSIPNPVNEIGTSDVNYFVIAFGATPYDPVNFNGTFDPMLVRWSDQNNPFEWVPATTNQAGEERLSNGSYLVTSMSTRQETLVWSDAAVYSMQYLGPPYVWGFTVLMNNVSIASPNAATAINNIAYWMGTDEFYYYSGVVQSLPCSLRRYVFEGLNFDQVEQVVCGINEGFKEIWWFYPSLNSLVNDSYVVFNFQENVWFYGTMNRTAWLDSGTRLEIMGAYSVQNTYLTMDIDAVTTTVAVLNANSFPIPCTVLIGTEQITYTSISNGTNLLGCIRGANGTVAAAHKIYSPVSCLIPNQIMNQESGTDDMSIVNTPLPIAAYIETSDTDIGDGDHFSFVDRIMPDLTFDGSTVSHPVVTLTVKPRYAPGANYISPVGTPTVTQVVPAPTPPASFPVEQYTEQVFTRVRGRQMAFRIESTGLGVAWQMGVMRVGIRPDGRR